MPRTAMLLCLAMLHAAGAVACAKSPEPPDSPLGMEELARAYDNPTALLPESAVRAVLAGADPAFLGSGPSLHFIPSAVNEASVEIRQTASSDPNGPIDIRGTVLLKVPCPGGGPDDASEAENGSIEATLGVEDATIRRGLTFVADRCKLVGTTGDVLTFVGSFTVTLATDIVLGSALPNAFLLRADAASVTIARHGATSTETRVLDGLSLRASGDGTAETLMDIAQLDLGVGATGTVVVSLRSDHSLVLRGRNGLWTCGSEGAPCVLL